jgi:hypothetical protein
MGFENTTKTPAASLQPIPFLKLANAVPAHRHPLLIAAS